MSGQDDDITDARVAFARERTALANERTLLAYVRTALAVAVVGATILNLIESLAGHVLGVVGVVAGVGILGFGLVRFRQVRQSLKHRS